MSQNTDIIQFPVLIGDIGGTNGRFQILVDAHAEPKRFPNLLTADFDSVEAAIQAGVFDKTSIYPRSVILAAAGPIAPDGLELTNCNWSIKPQRLIEELAVSEVILLNDFEAQALAATSYSEEDVVQIGSGQSNKYASRIVIGPGTGLGVSGLIHVRETWIPVPGEGGHVDIGPRSSKDFDIWPFLPKHNNRISAEELVSGRGILNIYNALVQFQENPAILKTPEEITAAALAGSDPVASEAIDLFCCYLGRIAGNVALSFMATGGVFIAGGICKEIASFLINSDFRREFENKYPHEALMADIPTYLVMHEAPALAGLAAFSRDPTRFGLETESRRWRSSTDAH